MHYPDPTARDYLMGLLVALPITIAILGSIFTFCLWDHIADERKRRKKMRLQEREATKNAMQI